MRLRQAWKIVDRYYSHQAAAFWRIAFEDPSIEFREIENKKMRAAHARVDKLSKREKRERHRKRQREIAAGCECQVISGYVLHDAECPVRNGKTELVQ